ncbi:uncharacterized protein JCM15063_004500 [Sporobolomyces koalae]|uniref:uncharacterized protein n=1 Tax=Sporobolomyces koalae TaxID=500713 RepID=UPI003172D275
MYTEGVRPPPSLTVVVPMAQTRAACPSFGIIPTYSHRIPPTRPRPSGRVQQSIHGGGFDDEDPFDLEEITLARIRRSIPARAHRHTPVLRISFDGEGSATSIEDPVVYRNPIASVPLPEGRSVTQAQRTSSVYSVSASSSKSSISPTSYPAARPSSSARTAQESLVDAVWHPSAPSDSPSSDHTHSSRTARPSRHPLPYSVTAQNPFESVSTGCPDRLGSELGRSLVVPPNQTQAAERLKRLYLCPWEEVAQGSNVPHIVPVTTLTRQPQTKGSTLKERIRSIGTSKQESIPAVGLPFSEKPSLVGTLNESNFVDKRDQVCYFFKLALVTVLVLALMIDLVILNVKVLLREDWQ